MIKKKKIKKRGISKRSHLRRNPTYKRLILLFSTIITLFFIFEIGFRIYYYSNNLTLGVSDDEKCFKDVMAGLPHTESMYRNFRLLGYHDIDPFIGLTIKSGFRLDEIEVTEIDNKFYKKVLYDYHHNEQGMRNLKNFPIEKSPEKERIALFGDSLTYGMGVPLKSGMSYLMGTIVADVEVLNFGVPGCGIDTMYARYMYEGRKYKPDIVVFNVYVEDISRPFTKCKLYTPNVFINNSKIKIGERRYEDLRDFYYSYEPPKFESYFIKDTEYKISRIAKNKRNFGKGLHLLDIMLDDIKDRTDEDSTVLIVGVIRGDHDHPLLDEYYQKIIEMLKSKDIMYFDSADYFNSVSHHYKDQSFYYIDGNNTKDHFSPIGNGVYAQGLLLELDKAGVLNITTEYHFTNFDLHGPVYLVNKKHPKNITIVYARGIEDLSYENQLFPAKGVNN